MAKFVADEHVHLVVDEPHGDFGDACGEFFVFDAVELVDVEPKDVSDVGDALTGFVKLAEDFEFEEAQLAVGDDEEIAASASGIEEFEGAEFFVELGEFVVVVANGLELAPKLVEEERFDEFKDVCFAGVVGTEVAAFDRVHYALKH